MRGESGQSLIELALGLTALTILMIGAAEFGRLAYASVEVSNAARAGVQYGAQNHTTASDTAGIQTAATQDAPDVSGISATASHSCVCSDGTASTCSAGDCPVTTSDPSLRLIETVQVNTTATVSPTIRLPGLPTSYTLTGKAVMRVTQ
jgi:Flp pilus assembly protein TadG